MDQLDLFISVGEISGDLLAYSVVQHLPKTLSVGGILGPKLRETQAKEYFPMELFEVHGLLSLIKSIPRIGLKHLSIKRKILALNPKVVVFVDNIEFSLLMARSLKRSGYKGKIVQLVCPSVWAWRGGRVKTLTKYFDLGLSLFPYETEYFEKTSFPVKFIGHPLIDELKGHIEEQTTPPRPIFALFPGSRMHEIELNFPIQLRAAKQLSDRYEIGVSVASPALKPRIVQLAAKEGVSIKLFSSSERYSLMKQADLALAKSGTTVFELGILGTPTVVMYKMNKIDLSVARKLKIFLPHYSLPNLLIGERIFPEYVGYFAEEHLIIKEVERLASNPTRKNQLRSISKRLLDLYQGKEAGKEASLLIQNIT